MQFDHLVFIGRFEPFHHGHRAVIERALTLAERVIVLVGSANKPRTHRNPWNAHEREVMIRESFPESRDRILIHPLRDHLYNETQWVTDVQRIVHTASGGSQKIGLIGYSKDRTSYYLKSFPQWKLVEAPNVEGVSATELRHSLFLMDEDPGQRLLLKAALPAPVFDMLMAFRTRPQFDQLRREFAFIRDYRKGWERAPYPPTFVTVDAVVVHSGHVLLVKRKAEPGKGLLALPGGFLNPDETIQDAAIRELKEETRIKLPEPVLRGSIRGAHVFDHPERSQRGRTITHAFHFDFPTGELPPVRGADDAEKAHWYPTSEALELEESFFEDHYHIVEHFLRTV